MKKELHRRSSDRIFRMQFFFCCQSSVNSLLIFVGIVSEQAHALRVLFDMKLKLIKNFLTSLFKWFSDFDKMVVFFNK